MRAPLTGRCRRAAVGRLSLLLSLGVAASSCAVPSVEGFSWKGARGAVAFDQTAAFPKGQEGRLLPERPANAYLPRSPIAATAGQSLELDLRVSPAAGDAPTRAQEPLRLTIALASDRKGKAVFFEASPRLREGRTRYAIPLPPGVVPARLALALADPKADPRGVELAGVAVLPAFRGLILDPEGTRLSPGFSLYRRGAEQVAVVETPFRDLGAEGGDGGAALVVEYEAGSSGQLSLSAPGAPPRTVRLRAAGAKLVLPAALFPAGCASLELRAPGALRLRSVAARRLPAEELELLDLGAILDLPARDPGADFDLYRWDLLPSVLVFDFKDYATQDRYLKRLAFFVEKKGFKGRLAPDAEIAGLHGWNAHDYRTEDLAAFFEAARASSFPLLREERELAGILAARGLIREKGGRFEAGEGALISITRESAPYLRSMFVTHESTHAVFFADAEYRAFVGAAWAAVPAEEKWFWKLYFGWMNYDTANAYLMANEFQAYLLQQPLFKVEEYFTKVLPPRLLENHPELAPRIEAYMKDYGASFALRAAELEGYLSRKYGILAGRAHFVQ